LFNLPGYGGGGCSNVFYNCLLTGNSGEDGGGAAYGILNDCIISNNGAIDGGGAYVCQLTNCTFISNSASYYTYSAGYGGGTFGGSLADCNLIQNTADFGGGAYGGTLTNCYIARNTGIDIGGGVCGDNNYPASLYGCLITTNRSGADGGGVSSQASSQATDCIVNNCTLSFNYAVEFGGGSFFAQVNNSLIVSNGVSRGGAGWGGGAEGGILNNCLVTGNASTTGGAFDGGNKPALAINCVFSNNLATSSGGGASSSSLVDCLIEKNSAGPISSGISSGGGTYGCSVTNCILAYNLSASGFGGGDCGSTLVNCIVVSNTATLIGGGGIYNSYPKNSIIYFNNTNDFYGYNASYSPNYCCIPQRTSGTNGVGNITNAPAFVNLAGGDFHLFANSPCINSGDNTYIAQTTDLDGNTRIVGGTVDIGAYEYQTPGSTLSYAWAQQYGLPTDGSVDNQDLDGTGMKNWQKSIAGLNPTNPVSVLAMQAPAVTNNSAGIIVTWQSVNTRQYYLQRDSTLTKPFSTIQSNLVGQVGTTSYTDTTATNGGPYFYRVAVQ
jgi:hypothetical protein